MVKVEPERARVVLDHEYIASIGMAPMVMPFKAASAINPSQFKPGDKVSHSHQQRRSPPSERDGEGQVKPSSRL